MKCVLVQREAGALRGRRRGGLPRAPCRAGTALQRKAGVVDERERLKKALWGACAGGEVKGALIGESGGAAGWAK